MNFQDLISKVKSIAFFRVNPSSIPQFLVSLWLSGLFIVWCLISLVNGEISDIPLGLLLFISILLGTNIWLNFGDQVNNQTPPNKPDPKINKLDNNNTSFINANDDENEEEVE